MKPAKTDERFLRSIYIVMAGLVPAIHVFLPLFLREEKEAPSLRLHELKLPSDVRSHSDQALINPSAFIASWTFGKNLPH